MSKYQLMNARKIGAAKNRPPVQSPTVRLAGKLSIRA